MALLCQCGLYTYHTTDAGMGMLKLEDQDDDITHQQTPSNLPKLSPVSRLLHAMSSWCTPDTWQLLTRIRRETGAQGIGSKVDGKGSFTGDSYGDTVNTDIVGATFEQNRGCATASSVVADHNTSSRGRDEGEGESRETTLPPVHSSAHSQIQMTIFVQQLKRK